MRRREKNQVPGSFSAAGKKISCPHCGGTVFTAGEAQLNTAIMTLIELDWLNKTAVVLSCTACGRIQWFAAEPVREG